MSPPSFRQPGDIVNDIYSENIQTIIKLCFDVGDDPNSLIEQTRRELQKMVTEMIAEDDALLERKRSELVPIRTRYESLYHELHPDKTCPQYGNTLPVLQALRIYVDEHKQLKEEHEKLLQREPDIRREERQLCNELNERSLQIDNSNFNSKQLVTQISLLSEHIKELREEKSKRINHLSEVIQILHEYEEVYGWKRPTIETMVGRLLVLDLTQIDQYTLSKEALELVDKEFSEITEQVQKAENRFEESHKQLKTLMRKHQSLIPNEKALAVSNSKQCRMSKLPDLIAEVDRYTEHAMEKLTSDILKARERIHLILNKLSVGDVTNNSKYAILYTIDRYTEHAMEKLTSDILKARERIHLILNKLSVGDVTNNSKYAILYTNDFTEDVYFMHEELVHELEAQYEMNRSLYEQIEAWNELFLEFQEFEKNASDPQRFHRRGYSALAEERTRKKLESSLRECELRLQKLADEFIQKNNGQPFIMSANGKEISDYIQQRKEDYTKAKEREREAAKAAHTTTATTGTFVGRTPLKTKQLVGTTPSATSKRSDQSTNTRTPLTTARRAGIPHLPTGKTPLNTSKLKTRAQQKQLQTTKRINMDATPSTISTPVKQRRLIDQIINTTENTSTHSLTIENTTAEHAMEKLTSDILKARERIHLILNKLSVGDVTNNSKYAILYTNDFTEDVYFMHEELVHELEAQYEMNRSMYEQIEAWNELFLEFQEFEKNASDPQRFHRRGYSALAEERTRKKLESSLRECEARLQKLADEFIQKNNGQPFIMSANGKEISDYIQQRKEDYTKAKEREREAAKAAHTTTATTGTFVGRTPLKTKQLVGTTPSATSKRSDQSTNIRTPLTTARRAGIPHLPTGKTPLNTSKLKTRAQQKQLPTTKRINMDATPSTISTPVKQRRLIDQIINTTENTSTHSLTIENTTAGLKSSMIVRLFFR
ncbi:unnamed protein product [Adineta steineri]|uniref:Protein regulator of cytokinesis 1 n=1 Tax=Adineta steineri TaxID=433720 RepID=A0A813TSY4_9BILA|nr:unnamed protein product [Adineta steineri]